MPADIDKLSQELATDAVIAHGGQHSRLAAIRFGVDSDCHSRMEQHERGSDTNTAAPTKIPTGLPSPSKAAVKKFQQVYKLKFGIQLDEAQSLEVATKLLYLFYVTESLHHLRSEVDRNG